MNLSERAAAGKARSKDSLRALEKFTHVVDGELRILSDPPLIVPAEELMPEAETRDLRQALLEVLASYRATLPADRQHLLDGYRLRHIARKVVGVGSVGTRAWVVLMTGADDGGRFDEAIAEFAELYEDQSERDHAALVSAIDSGRLAAEDA